MFKDDLDIYFVNKCLENKICLKKRPRRFLFLTVYYIKFGRLGECSLNYNNVLIIFLKNIETFNFLENEKIFLNNSTQNLIISVYSNYHIKTNFFLGKLFLL